MKATEMKLSKILLRIMSIGLICAVTAIGLTVCCKAMHRTVNASAVELGPKLERTEKTGGWTDAKDTELTEERIAIFNKATERLLGVNYEPVEYLGSQVVAGINHCYLCWATPVSQDAAPHLVRVYIYEDLNGGCTVTEIVEAGL